MGITMRKLTKGLTIVFGCVFMFAVMAACSTPAQEEEPLQSGATPQAEQSQVEEASQEEAMQEPAEQTTDEAAIVKSGVITDGEHDVAAVVNLYSDNTLEIVGLSYDGKAPDVYIAIGNKTEGGAFEKTELVTEKFEGSYENHDITIELGEGKEFTAVSVYCDVYAEDFGSVILQDVE